MDVNEQFWTFLTEGLSRDQALSELRSAGASPLDCIRAIVEVERVGIAEAKRIFSESTSWANYVRANDEALISELEAMEREEAERNGRRIRVMELLSADVAATLGPAHVGIVEMLAPNVASLDFVDSDPNGFRDQLVEDVQQYIHDCFIDTTWPTCPRHRKHPLWLNDDGAWCCVQGEVFARLGELRSIWTNSSL